MYVGFRLADGAQLARRDFAFDSSASDSLRSEILREKVSARNYKDVRKAVQCRYSQLDVFFGHGFRQTLGQRP